MIVVISNVTPVANENESMKKFKPSFTAIGIQYTDKYNNEKRSMPIGKENVTNIYICFA